jgi:hypothetical protein
MEKKVIAASQKFVTHKLRPNILEIIGSKECKEIIKADLSRIWEGSVNSDDFFGVWGSSIVPLNSQGKAEQGIMIWLKLLETIKEINPKKYENIHKGTAFYHLSVAHMFSGRWTEAFEWMDYAFEQDCKKRSTLPESPALWFLSFDPREFKRIKPWDYDITRRMEICLENILKKIEGYDSSLNIDIGELRKKVKEKILFVNSPLSSPSVRSAWSCFLGTLMHEKESSQFLNLGPKKNFAQIFIQRELLNLTLILETLLKKKYYSDNQNSEEKITLGILINKKPLKFLNELTQSISKISKDEITGNPLPSEEEISKLEKKYSKKTSSFILAYTIRNEIHHGFQTEPLSAKQFDLISLRLNHAIFLVLEEF